jgi:hypothetical protein
MLALLSIDPGRSERDIIANLRLERKRNVQYPTLNIKLSSSKIRKFAQFPTMDIEN